MLYRAIFSKVHISTVIILLIFNYLSVHFPNTSVVLGGGIIFRFSISGGSFLSLFADSMAAFQGQNIHLSSKHPVKSLLEKFTKRFTHFSLVKLYLQGYLEVTPHILCNMFTVWFPQIHIHNKAKLTICPWNTVFWYVAHMRNKPNAYCLCSAL